MMQAAERAGVDRRSLVAAAASCALLARAVVDPEAFARGVLGEESVAMEWAHGMASDDAVAAAAARAVREYDAALDDVERLAAAGQGSAAESAEARAAVGLAAAGALRAVTASRGETLREVLDGCARAARAAIELAGRGPAGSTAGQLMARRVRERIPHAEIAAAASRGQ
jgi:hypothetical protein